jgi:hypothetical protein
MALAIALRASPMRPAWPQALLVRLPAVNDRNEFTFLPPHHLRRLRGIGLNGPIGGLSRILTSSH